jgi:signal peptidase I
MSAPHPVPATPVRDEWPRMVEPESEEAWAALGISHAPTRVDLPTLASLPGVTQAPVVPTPLPRRPSRGSHVLRRIAEETFAWVKTLASAAVYATLIVTFGFQVARVEGQSMAPTLEDQDRLIVNKLAYQMDAPQVGDIVMLTYPRDPKKSFVKRVIAEPLDTVRIEDGTVYVNDVPVPDDFIPEEFKSTDNLQADLVPEGYYFVMGDHRNNSSDSRHWGYVPRNYILGKVQLRWWPFNHARVF